jgi:hypothetical protein
LTVSGDRFLQPFEVWSDQLGQADKKREVDEGHVQELLPEVVEGPLGEALQIGGGLACQQCDVSSRELLLRRPASDPTAALDLAS